MKTYDPKKILVIVGGVPLSGFADGSFVRVARNNDMWTMSTGADGEGTRSKSNDRSGTIEVTLKQTSRSNQYLSNLALADELDNAGVVPGMVKDGMGATLHLAEQLWVKKRPDSEYAKEAGDRVWVLETDVLTMSEAGN